MEDLRRRVKGVFARLRWERPWDVLDLFADPRATGLPQNAAPLLQLLGAASSCG